MRVTSVLLTPTPHAAGADAGEHSSAGPQAAGPAAPRGGRRPHAHCGVAQHAQLVLGTPASALSAPPLLTPQPGQAGEGCCGAEAHWHNLSEAWLMEGHGLEIRGAWWCVEGPEGASYTPPSLCTVFLSPHTSTSSTRRFSRGAQTGTATSPAWRGCSQATPSPWCWVGAGPGEGRGQCRQGWDQVP